MKKHPVSRVEVEDGTSAYRLPRPLPTVQVCSSSSSSPFGGPRGTACLAFPVSSKTLVAQSDQVETIRNADRTASLTRLALLRAWRGDPCRRRRPERTRWGTGRARRPIVFEEANGGPSS